MSFDIASFLNTSFEGATSTKIIRFPTGVRYLFQVDPIDPDAIRLDTGIVKREDSKMHGKRWAKLTVACHVIDPSGELEAAIKRKPVVRHSIMLDLTEDGALDLSEGRNVNLGRFRAALNYNNDEKWSFQGFRGKLFKAEIKYGSDENAQPELTLLSVAD